MRARFNPWRPLHRHRVGWNDGASKRFRGSFILSLNIVPELRRLFGAFATEEVEITSHSRAPDGVIEFLISGYCR